ncbi:hypothetical protein RDI58_029054 [Solanum bulbocastanum]|uniref:FMN-dependent dehydrogenase domain-containing protein n=1 Tax=Solanum bulbocastanum TaxID=147425 RepID=A0AAN8XZ91_SOLBU
MQDVIIIKSHGAVKLSFDSRGKVPVLIEGGIRRGTDIFKALALSSKAAFVNLMIQRNEFKLYTLIGRSVIYGLAANGESGVKQVIEMLKHELEQTIALTG